MLDCDREFFEEETQTQTHAISLVEPIQSKELGLCSVPRAGSACSPCHPWTLAPNSNGDSACKTDSCSTAKQPHDTRSQTHAQASQQTHTCHSSHSINELCFGAARRGRRCARAGNVQEPIGPTIVRLRVFLCSPVTVVLCDSKRGCGRALALCEHLVRALYTRRCAFRCHRTSNTR